MVSLYLCAGPAAAMAVTPAPPERADPGEPAGPGEPGEPGSAAECLARASRALRLRRHADALRWFDQAIERAPGLSLARLGRAATLAEMGREAEARDELEGCLALGFEDAAGPLVLARWSLLQGDARLALGLVGAALQAEPRLADAVARDQGFAPLRDHPAFLQMVGAL